MQNDPSSRPVTQPADLDALPDVPDAGDDSQPITPPQPVDISTATLTSDAEPRQVQRLVVLLVGAF